MDPKHSDRGLADNEFIKKYDPMLEQARKIVDQLDDNKMIDSMGLGSTVAAIAGLVDKIDDTIDSMQKVDSIEDSVTGFFGGKKHKDKDEEGRKPSRKSEDDDEGGSGWFGKKKDDEEEEEERPKPTKPSKKYEENEEEGSGSWFRKKKDDEEGEKEESGRGSWFSKKDEEE